MTINLIKTPIILLSHELNITVFTLHYCEILDIQNTISYNPPPPSKKGTEAKRSNLNSIIHLIINIAILHFLNKCTEIVFVVYMYNDYLMKDASP